jgi:hypothetical protein
VTPGIDLSTLSHAEKDALILSLLPLIGQLEAVLARVAELGKRLAAVERPPIAIGRRRTTLKETTLAQYHADLDRRPDRIMAAIPIGEPGRKRRKRIAANRARLFVFVTNRDVPCTNNVSERNPARA